jgi:hypothetical protein
MRNRSSVLLLVLLPTVHVITWWMTEAAPNVALQQPWPIATHHRRIEVTLGGLSASMIVKRRNALPRFEALGTLSS